MKFIIRIDDISPTMNLENFDRIKHFLVSKNIRPIIGVVPDNQDENLKFSSKNEDFWPMIRNLKQLGWSIAQHGCHHKYSTVESGILKINNFSEFAGLSFKEQLKKIITGKNILIEQKIWEPIFMAPAHSFDDNTLKALKEADFKYVTDGYGLYPWSDRGLTFIPQLFSGFSNFGFGVYTVCIHLNELSEKEVDNVINQINGREHKIIDLPSALNLSRKQNIFEEFFFFVFKYLLFIKRRIFIK